MKHLFSFILLYLVALSVWEVWANRTIGCSVRYKWSSDHISAENSSRKKWWSSKRHLWIKASYQSQSTDCSGLGYRRCQKLLKLEGSIFTGRIVVTCRLSWVEVVERTEIIIRMFFLKGAVVWKFCVRDRFSEFVRARARAELLIVSLNICKANLVVSS
jgi:hypothetical protein